jgi:hypothetical protein
MRINYKQFIEDNFYIKNKEGVIVPFIFNNVQNVFYEQLKEEYPNLQGVRENILKGRQFGLSSVITGIFATDFILSEQGEIPIIDSDVYSHKDDETDAHIARFNMFINSYLIKDQGGDESNMEDHKAIETLRKEFLRVDNGGEIVSRKRQAQYHAQTASAKVSGRGGTKQNIHWSEVAFYPNTQIMNAKKLVVGAEKQVPLGIGKIFRETTGNMAGDYFSQEYQEGKDGVSVFKSRFYAWYLHSEYTLPAPEGWSHVYYKQLLDKGLADINQCYWHYTVTKGLEDKEELREYPTYDFEAFLMGGNVFFSKEALMHYTRNIQKPIKEVQYAASL